MLRRIAIATVLAAMLAGLSWGAIAAEKVPITVWFYSAKPAVTEWAKEFEAKFAASNPDIELHFDVVDWSTIRQKVIVASAAGTGPDIAYFPANLIPEWINNGMTLPLNRYLNQYKDKKDFMPGVFDTVTDGSGQIHAMPFAMWGIFDLYNLDLFDNNGVSLPEDWNSLIASARKITQVTSDGSVKTYGYVVSGGDTMASNNQHMAMEQLGKGMLYMGDTKVSLNNERGIQAANYIRDLWQAGMPDYNHGASDLRRSVSGDVAVQGYATYNVLTLDSEDTGRLQPRRHVGPKPGQDVVRHNSGVLYILSTSKNPDEAWRVLEGFLEPENNREYLRAQVEYLPVRVSMLSQVMNFIPHEFVPKMAQIMYPPMTTYGPVHDYWISLRPTAGSTLLKVFQNKMGIEEGLGQAEEVMNAILAEKMGVK